MSDETIDPSLIEQTRQQIRQLVEEIDQLAGSDLPPQRFYPEFLQRVVAAVAAVGGAVWLRDEQGSPRLLHQINFGQSGLLEEAALVNGHGGLLHQKFSDGKPELVPPRGDSGSGVGSNPSDWSLIISPLTIDSRPVGMVEVLLDPRRREAAQRNAVRFVSELCEMGSEYIRNQQLRRMINQQQVWSQLETFTREIHQSLDPKEVAYIVANEGKRLVKCDRVSVAIKYGRKAVVEGVSGQEVVERRGNLVRLMTRLANAVVRSDEDLTYAGDSTEALPPAVQDALDDFLAESDSKTLVVMLLRDRDKDGNPTEVIGALIAEEFGAMSSADDISARTGAIAQHAAVAIDNALTHHRIFLLPVWRTLGRATKWLRGNRLAKLSIAVAGIAGIVAALIWVPWELRLEGKGEILPAVRKNIFASDVGRVTSVDVDHGQLVGKNQVLLRMTSLDLDRQLVDIEGRLRQAFKQQDLVGGSPEINLQKAIALIQIAYLEEEKEILEQREANLTARAPIDGMVATLEPKRVLANKPVNRGDPLLTLFEIGTSGADWVLEIKMPEDRMGHIRRAVAEHGKDKPLTAKFILGSYPEAQLHGHVVHIASTAELDQEEREHTVLIRIVPDGIEDIQIVFTEDKKFIRSVRMKFKDRPEVFELHPGAQVTAKIECGKHALGFVLLRELIEFVYETVIF